MKNFCLHELAVDIMVESMWVESSYVTCIEVTPECLSPSAVGREMHWSRNTRKCRQVEFRSERRRVVCRDSQPKGLIELAQFSIGLRALRRIPFGLAERENGETSKFTDFFFVLMKLFIGANTERFDILLDRKEITGNKEIDKPRHVRFRHVETNTEVFGSYGLVEVVGDLVSDCRLHSVQRGLISEAKIG